MSTSTERVTKVCRFSVIRYKRRVYRRGLVVRVRTGGNGGGGGGIKDIAAQRPGGCEAKPRPHNRHTYHGTDTLTFEVMEGARDAVPAGSTVEADKSLGDPVLPPASTADCAMACVTGWRNRRGEGGRRMEAKSNRLSGGSSGAFASMCSTVPTAWRVGDAQREGEVAR